MVKVAAGTPTPKVRACSGPTYKGREVRVLRSSLLGAISPLYLHERAVVQVEDLLVRRHSIRGAMGRRAYLEDFAAFGPNKDPLIHGVDRTDMTPPVTGLRVEERVAEVLKFVFSDQLHALVENLWVRRGRDGRGSAVAVQLV